MHGPLEMLRAPEAAVVARVDVRDVNRVIDERILPEGFFAVEDGRRVWAPACTLIDFYFASAKRLTAEERSFAIETVGKRLYESRALSFAELVHNDWTVRHEFLTIDLSRFFKNAKEGMDRLVAARDMVVCDPEILSGTPSICGTRIPVHDIGAAVAAGVRMEELLDSYPALNREKIELAAIYTAANPSRGRPRMTEIPKGATIITDRWVPLRRKAE